MNEDLKELKGYLEERFTKIDEQFDRSFEVFATRDDTQEIKQELGSLKEIVQALAVSTDKLVKAITDLKIEYTMVSAQLSRHEKWIQRLAGKLGLELEY